MAKKDKLITKPENLEDALTTIDELLKENEELKITAEGTKKALEAKIAALEKALAGAKENGTVKTGSGVVGVSSQFLNVRGR